MECKEIYRTEQRRRTKVLIETYWNVKTDPVVITGDIRAGINRNILECKAQRMIASHLYLSVLIETYWNVKMDDLFLDTYYFFVLIETYWNVKHVDEQ